MKKFLYYFVQFTWGLIENIIGFIVFLFFISKPHSMYKNSFRTSLGDRYSGSFSIGNFIFIAEDLPCSYDNYTLRHEYGHCKQNLFYGPLSLFIFKIPSVIHFWVCNFKHDFTNYYKFYPEKYANLLGGNK